jgi:pilus assembly protein TadC
VIPAGVACVIAGTVALVAALRRDTAVERRLARLAPALRGGLRWRPVADRDLRHARIVRTQAELILAKVVGLLAGGSIGAVLGGFVGASAILSAVSAYGGWVGPSLAVERRAAARRRDAERALGPFLERLEALAAAGRPVESAVAALARVPTGAGILDGTLARVADGYALGAPLFRSLGAEAREEALASLADLAAALERARDLGHGSLAVVRDQRDAARGVDRTASLAAAATVEGKLMLSLVLCYLPALMLLVVVPLFLTLLDGLFG